MAIMDPTKFDLITTRNSLTHARDFRLPPRCKWDLRSSGILRGLEEYFYRRFGTIHRSHHQGSISPTRMPGTLKYAAYILLFFSFSIFLITIDHW